MTGGVGRWLYLVASFVVLAAAAPVPRSGYTDASPATRSMQDDDSANPAFLWVKQGETLWSTSQDGGKSCADCHGAPASMRGVVARYPAFDAARSRPVTLEQRINLCRTEHQAAEKLEQDSDSLLSLSALVGLQSRGMPVHVQQDGPMQPFHDDGARLYATQMGQLNLSCHQCHDGLAGQKLAGSLIPQGHANGYPLYRLEWQSMGSLYRRIRNCLTGVRATPFSPDAPELVAIEIYLAGRAQGLVVETPAVRP
jgi:sulfur-oxidizing protein SoxA